MARCVPATTDPPRRQCTRMRQGECQHIHLLAHTQGAPPRARAHYVSSSLPSRARLSWRHRASSSSLRAAWSDLAGLRPRKSVSRITTRRACAAHARAEFGYGSRGVIGCLGRSSRRRIHWRRTLRHGALRRRGARRRRRRRARDSDAVGQRRRIDRRRALSVVLDATASRRACLGTVGKHPIVAARVRRVASHGARQGRGWRPPLRIAAVLALVLPVTMVPVAMLVPTCAPVLVLTAPQHDIGGPVATAAAVKAVARLLRPMVSSVLVVVVVVAAARRVLLRSLASAGRRRRRRRLRSDLAVGHATALRGPTPRCVLARAALRVQPRALLQGVLPLRQLHLRTRA